MVDLSVKIGIELITQIIKLSLFLQNFAEMQSVLAVAFNCSDGYDKS